MPAEIRTPFIKSRALMTAPSVWRKKVLPVGEVEYQGRMLQFDRDYLEDLAAAFKAGAYDQVPFQLATDDNKHTNNPERTRGWVTGVEVQNDGLWVTARVTPEGNKVLTSNPNLGVSARIVEEYARSDGNFFPAAIQHVLGTLDPRIPGLGPWEAVEMSNSAGVDMIIDLSAAEFAGEEGGSTMPDMDADQQARLARLLELDPDEIAGLLDQLNEDASDDTEDETMDEDELIAAINSMTDDEFAQVAAEFDVAEPAPQYAGAALSNDYGMSEIELANYRLAETERQMSILQREHDKQAFENEKRRMLNLGVPLYITELARPLLEGTGRTVELSNGQTADSGLIMRKVLTEFGKAANMIDMSGEIGSPFDNAPDTSRQAEQARITRVSEIRGQLGI